MPAFLALRPALLLLGACSAGAEQVAVDSDGSQQPASSQASLMQRSSRIGCHDERPDCADLAGEFLQNCADDTRVMLKECRATCESCAYSALIDEALDCADTNDGCKAWADAGECEKNPKYMRNACTTSCGECEAKQTGCRRKNSTAPMAVPGGMRAMFGRSLRDFPQYEPTALSTDPYVVQFENLLTAEEAEAMVGACKAFDRSLAGDQLSPVRTSTQCWCDDKEETHGGKGCMGNEIVHAVTMRMLNVTMLPFENAEYLQVLRYEPGQFYKQHHDQQSGHWTPQGVRMYTFFVYLSDVEEGGGTRFTNLGITVQPKLGRGVLWPSVYDHDLRTSDMRTHHEALPVVRGLKYATNLWQHHYDFKTPSKEGLCIMLGKNSNHN